MLSCKPNACGRSALKSFSFSTNAFIIQPLHQFRPNIKIALRTHDAASQDEIVIPMNCVVIRLKLVVCILT